MTTSTVILVTSEGLGKAERDLQLQLAGKYFSLLAMNDTLPNAICFYIEAQFSADKVITI